MGQEISQSVFRPHDFQQFRERLRIETALLERWWNEGRFPPAPHVAGYEIEAWLIDADGYPVPRNRDFLERANERYRELLVFPELARFNIELNSLPRRLSGDALAAMHAELERSWRASERIAADLGLDVLMIGTLPTAQEAELSLENMSEMQRYRALNQQVLRMREGRPLELNIEGRQPLRTSHRDVMLEAATTSLQLHLQVTPTKAARYYNVAQMVSAVTVAVGANSPWLFGHQLWEETRIPLFEQAVEVPANTGCDGAEFRRVGFGSGYAEGDLLACFRENRDCYPPLLPIEVDKYPAALAHLRLHNGTIWRWNRPLVGLDDDGSPHLRIEHRVIAAGPSVIDTVANAALFYGLITELAESMREPEADLPFSLARDNFYTAARHGLDAHVVWFDGVRNDLQGLILDELLPRAASGLARLDIDAEDAARFLGVIERRVRTRRTGAWWQRHCAEMCGAEMPQLVQAYRAHQRSGLPVHEWPLPGE
ncbi:MAG: glutamate--cysteine ligase [Gammaproteobacteria bacterium]|nr:glutamate--cysteine ligase [Gammaproteobacteria bacterium]MCP5137762.1 glutamate--cysteine ligase [Gammaproteobacteria bacterium]